MKRSRPIVMMGVLLLLLLVLVWQFLHPEAVSISNHVPVAEKEDAEPRSDSPLSLEGRAGSAETSRTAVQTKQEIDPSADRIDEPVHAPNYGIAVQRGGAYATFHLTDAKDQPLYRPEVGVELWRRVGSHWIKDVVQWDSDRRIILCQGRSAVGLEPSEYELEVTTKKYGNLLHRFRVNKGEHLESSVRTDTWRRIICIDFRHRDGRSIDWVKEEPEVTTTLDIVEFEKRPERPESVLRDPPPEPPTTIRLGGGIGGGGGRGGLGTKKKYMIATDDGRFYVPVIAGAMNTVTFELGGFWGLNHLSLEDRFTAARWDWYQVTLDLAPNFEELTKGWLKLGTNEGPGARQHLDWLERERILLPPDDRSAILERWRNCRLVVEIEAPDDMRVVCGVQRPHEETCEVDKVMARRGSVHYLDARSDATIWYCLSHNGRKITAPESVAFGYREFSVRGKVHRVWLPGRVVKIKRTVLMRSLPTPDWKLTPTLDAWAVQRRLSLELDRKDDEDTICAWNLDLTRTTLWSPEKLLDLANEEATESARCSWRLGAPSGQGTVHVAHIKAEELGKSLTGGGLSPPTPSGLVFRLVGPENEGLPWVEGSIIPYGQEVRARRLRGVERALAAEALRPTLSHSFGRAYYGNEDSFREETIDPSVMKGFLGDKFLEHTDDRGDLAYYARSGAWYDTRARIQSDYAGYVFAANSPVKGSGIYVLYLWSNSRDDLQPDARIVFRATGGLTDLGAIELPTYTK